MPPPPRKPMSKGPPRATEEAVLSRARGALFGLAVGEALGLPNERRKVVTDQFPQLNEGPLVELQAGGPRRLKAGQVSWGAEMASCLSAALRDGLEFSEAANAYSRWLTDAVGPPWSVKPALALVRQGHMVEAVGRRVWLDSGRRLEDNAALARTAPIGVYFARHRSERIRLSLEDTGLTHFAPVCQLASVIINAAVAAALTSPKEPAEPAELLKAIIADLGLAAAGLARQEPDLVGQVRDAAEQVKEDIALAQQADPLLYGPELYLFSTPASVRVTLRLALWELFHAPSFEAAVIDVANRGGDAPVNTLVTGAVLGAVHGDQAIPERWREVVLESPLASGGPHWELYHPRHLVTLTPKP